MDRVCIFCRLIAGLILLAVTALLASRVDADGPEPAKKEDLRYDGKPFSYWQSYAKTELKAERRIDALWAMAAFGSRGYAPEATQVIVEMVKDFSPDNIGYSEKPATPDEKVVNVIHEAIVKIGPDAAVVLLKHLDDARVRALSGNIYVYARLVGRGPMGSISIASVSVLIDKMQFNEKDTQRAAAAILNNFLKEESIRKAFQIAIKDKNTANAIATALARSEDFSSAVPILEILGPQARPALSFLVQATLGEEKNETVISAKKTLGKMKPTSVELLAGLTQALKGRLIQSYAATELAKLGKPAAIPALLEAANKPVTEPNFYDLYAEARLAQIDALIRLDADKKEILRAIRKLLRTAELVPSRHEAVKRFLKLEEDAPRIVALLTMELQRPVEFGGGYQDFIHDLIIALGKQGSKAKSAVSVLLKTYENWSGTATRILVIQTLGRIGPDAKGAIPFLNGLLQSENAEIRRAAAQAIEAITQSKRER